MQLFQILLILYSLINILKGDSYKNLGSISNNPNENSDQLIYLICMHAGPPLNMESISISFNYIQELGANGVRTDAAWAAIEPTQNNYSNQALEFYQTYFQTAFQFGLTESMLILSSPPDWARELWKDGTPQKRKEFLQSFSNFVELVVKYVGLPVGIKRYQLWNQPNAFPSTIFWDDIPDILNAGGSILQQLVPDKQIFVNPNCDQPGWQKSIQKWCSQAGTSFNSIGVDHYPGTWSLFGWQNWVPLQQILQYVNDQQNPCYGQIPALLETGYSSFSKKLGHGDNKQSEWVLQSFTSAIQIVKESVSQKFQANIITFYELYDEGGPQTFPPQEAHFGLIHDNVQKPAFQSLKNVIHSNQDNLN